MTEAGVKTFAIFFSVDLDNKREAERMVLLRRYLEEGFGAGTTIIDEALLTECRTYPFLVIAQAHSREAIAAALAPTAGVYCTKIIEVDALDFNPEVPPAQLCVFVTDNNPLATASLSQTAHDSICVRTRIELPAGSPCSGVWLMNAPMAHDARRYVQALQPGAIIGVMNAMTARNFFENKFSTSPREIVQLPQFETAVNDSPADFALTNEDTVQAWVGDHDPASDYIFRFNARSTVDPGATINLQNNAYIWNVLASTAAYNILVPSPPLPLGIQTVPTSYPPPSATFAHVKNGHIGFNLSDVGSAHAISDFSTFLHDLLVTTKFDAPWPEDNYSGEQKAVYDYFLTQLPSAPKDGNLSPGFVEDVDYPSDKPFSQDVFNAVKRHLHDECIYFEDAQQWFGINGIFAAINSQIAIVSGPSLIAAANLMSIEPEQTILMEVLDTIFSDIASLIAIIPVYGAAISAAIRVTWSIAKVLVDAANPHQSNTPIQARVADMADVLNAYLDQQVIAVAAEFKLIKGNWGKLQSFGLAKESGKISEDQLDVSILPGGGPVTVSQGYVQAAANAWSLIIYKSLFASRHTAKARITFGSDRIIPNIHNPWNPAAGNYNYRYFLLCTYANGTNDPNHQGYCVFDCETDAPQEVLQHLFGPGSAALNVDPVEFFVGYNGWPTIIPDLYSFDAPPSTPAGPIIKFGW
jgi:hypothetical protein